LTEFDLIEIEKGLEGLSEALRNLAEEAEKKAEGATGIFLEQTVRKLRRKASLFERAAVILDLVPRLIELRRRELST
jgi:hypothetical protein